MTLMTAKEAVEGTMRKTYQRFEENVGLTTLNELHRQDGDFP